MERRVADSRDRARPELPRAPSDHEPAALERERSVEVGAGEEVALGGPGAAHRLLVRERKRVDVIDRRPLGDLGAPAVACVGSDLLRQPRTHRARPRWVVDEDSRALRRPGEPRLGGEPLAAEHADQRRRRPVDPGAPWRDSVALNRAAGIPVRRDGVAKLRARDLADDQRDQRRPARGGDPQRVGRPLRGEELRRAEEVVGAGGGRAVVREQLGGRARRPAAWA